MQAHFWDAAATQDLVDQQSTLVALVRLIGLRESHLQPGRASVSHGLGTNDFDSSHLNLPAKAGGNIKEHSFYMKQQLGECSPMGHHFQVNPWHSKWCQIHGYFNPLGISGILM